MKPQLNAESLRAEAELFARAESLRNVASLYGVTDGKAVGTYLEQQFRTLLGAKYTFVAGNAAKGIDFPDLNVDLKSTSSRQPQSSSPFRSASQKILGLGYSLLIFVYQKTDDVMEQTARLQIVHTIFVEAERTADYQTPGESGKLLTVKVT